MPDEDDGIVLSPETYGRFDRAASRLEKEPEIPLRDTGRGRPPDVARIRPFCLKEELVYGKTAKAARVRYNADQEPWWRRWEEVGDGDEEARLIDGGAGNYPRGAVVAGIRVPGFGIAVVSNVFWGHLHTFKHTPAHAVCAVDESELDDGAVTLVPPGSDPLANEYMFTLVDDDGVEREHCGAVVPCVARPPCWAKYDPADGVPQAGELWGPVAGSLRLKKQPEFQRTVSFPHTINVELTSTAYGSCECEAEVTVEDVTETVQYGFKVIGVDQANERAFIVHSTTLVEDVVNRTSP